MKINEIVIENRERTDELAPLLIPVAGAIAGAGLSALELAQQYGEYKDMVRKAKAMPKGPDRQKALDAAENYYDEKYNTALVSLGVGAAAGATMGPVGGFVGRQLGKAATKAFDPLKSIWKKVTGKGGKIDPDKVADTQKSLDNYFADPNVQKQIQKVANQNPTGPASKIPPKPLAADPKDRIIRADPVEPPKSTSGKLGSAALTARDTAAATTATGTTGAISALQGSKKRLANQKRRADTTPRGDNSLIPSNTQNYAPSPYAPRR